MSHRFEVAGVSCGVQSCDSHEANVFFSADKICTYARLILGEFEFSARTTDKAKAFFTANKSAFMAKVAELAA
jgi:5'-deoxynucleotidase YfbR-like HD superfamily hydrolase